MLKALIFDFDGLIIDTETVWYSIFKEWLLERYDYDLTVTEFTQCVGSNSIKMFASIGNKLNTRIDVDEFLKYGEPIFNERSSDLEALPGVIPLIKEAKSRGLKVALATSSRKERPLYHLNRLNIIQHFDAITTCDDVAETKPAPDLFIKTLDRLGIKPEEALIFEDSNNGLIAGNLVGIPVVLVPNDITREIPFEEYSLIVESLESFDLDSL